MTWTKELQQIIHKKLNSDGKMSGERKVSLRALSYKAGLSSGALSEMLSGKRLITIKTGLKLLNALNLPPEVKENLTQSIQSSRTSTRNILSEDAVKVMKEWQYFAILSLFELESPPNTAKLIAERLNISEVKAQESLDRLATIGILKKKSEIYTYDGRLWKLGDSGSSSAIKEFHRGGLTLALEALDFVDVSNRDFTALVFAGNEKNLEKARKEIRKFYSKLSKLMVLGPATSVYRLNIQLFPLDRWEKTK